jgi:hypothetical protein
MPPRWYVIRLPFTAFNLLNPELCGNVLLLAKYGLIFPVGGTSRREVQKIHKKILSWAPPPSKFTVNKGFSPFWGAMLLSPPDSTPLAAPHHP